MTDDKKPKWPPAARTYHDPDRRPACRHVDKPSEPWGKRGELGSIVSVAPAAKGIAAMAYVDWGEYQTWERLADLRPV